MKILTKSIVILMTIVLLFSCDTNKKLNLESAEMTIKEFATQNSFSAGLWQKGSFSANSITSIEPISQFTESEASSIVHFDFQDSYADGKLVLKFNFKKNMDKKWVLTSVDAISGVGSQGMSNRINKWQDVNILVEDNPKANKTTFFEKIQPNQDGKKEDKFSGVYKGHETVYTITLNPDGTYNILYDDMEMNSEKSIGYYEDGKLRFATKDYQGKDYVHYFVLSSTNCIRDGNYEYCKE